MKISLIVAMARNRVIGRDNKMPWHLPEDLRYFKRVTLNKPVIMGRNTFESIGKPLVQRSNFIVSRNPQYQVDGAIVVHSLGQALQMCSDLFDTIQPEAESEVMIIGGAQIYEQSLALAQRMYLTEVHADLEGDASFPDFDKKQWREVSREDHKACDKNPYDYSFLILEKVSGKI